MFRKAMVSLALDTSIEVLNEDIRWQTWPCACKEHITDNEQAHVDQIDQIWVDVCDVHFCKQVDKCVQSEIDAAWCSDPEWAPIPQIVARHELDVRREDADDADDDEKQDHVDQDETE